MTARANVSLRLPCHELREGYIECLRDFQAEDPSRPIQWSRLEDFDRYLDWTRRTREQVGIVDGRPPETTYWIVVDGLHAVGKLTLRHELTPDLEKLGGHFGYEIRPAFRRRGIATRALALGLEDARSRGIRGIVVTCDDDNVGSIGVLENNGGRLLAAYALPNWPRLVRKYAFPD